MAVSRGDRGECRLKQAGEVDSAMKGLVITLLIMGVLYLMVFRKQAAQMHVLPASAEAVDSTQQAVTPGANPLQPYQQALDKAKGMEAMLNQGLDDRMRNVDGLESRE